MIGQAGGRWRWLRLVASAAVLLAAGCRLIDQTSFGGAPRAPAPDQLRAALASRGAEPLLVIRADDDSSYHDGLKAAIDAAAARDGAVRFRLEAVAPSGGGLDAEQRAMDAASAQARRVLDEMGDDGIAPDRVALSARTDPAVRTAEIRLYAG